MTARNATRPLGGGQMATNSDTGILQVYQPYDVESVAEMLVAFEGKWRYRPADDLEMVIAHAEMYIGVAIHECEIRHGTEYLDTLHAQRLAAISVLASRERKGYTIEADPGGFDRGWLDDLKARVSIAHLLEGRGHTLRPVGRGYKVQCPLPDHDDRSPSFHVYVDTNSYYCFGCGAHGDVFDLLMALDSLTFPQSVEAAARIAGMAVPK